MKIVKEEIIIEVCENLSSKAIIHLFKYFEFGLVNNLLTFKEETWLKVLFNLKCEILPISMRLNFKKVI